VRRLVSLLVALTLLAGVLLGADPAAAQPAPLWSGVRLNALPQAGTAAIDSPSQSLDPRAAALAARLRRSPSGSRAAAQRLTADAQAARELQAAVAELRRRVGTAVEVRLREPAGTPRLVKGAVLERAAAVAGRPRTRDEATARAFLRSNRQLLRLDDPDGELTITRWDTDALGHRHLRFAQTHRGLPVWPSDVLVHLDPSGNVSLLNGAFVPTPRSVGVTPALDAAHAEQHARAAVPRGATVAVRAPELVIYAPGDRPPRLAWRLEVRAGFLADYLVLIDARDGSRLLAYNRVMDANVPGAGQDLFGVARPLNVFQEGGQFFLIDTSKPMFDLTSDPPSPTTTRGAIFVFDAQNQPPTSNPQTVPPVAPVTSTSATAGFLADGVSAAFNLSETYDYFLEKHNRNSLDGRGTSMQAIVRYGLGVANAFFLSAEQLMVFGDAGPFAGALDVVAHELTHGVTDHSANLIYQDQSGALNEAFSDVFGELVEARTLGDADFITGSQLASSLRNLRDPNSREIIPGLGRRYPAKMSQFVAPTDPFLDNFVERDNGGVHINSTIIAHAFFLLARGLPGAIGLDDAGRIFYRALTVHLVSNSQFIDARLAAVQSAEELFGAGSAQALKTAEAFDAVELFDASGTPPPPDRAPVTGEDATLFVFFDPDLGGSFVGRRESAFGDPAVGVRLSSRRVLGLARPSVTRDGRLAAFVSANQDFCLIPTDASGPEECLGFAGLVSSVAVSPDGLRFGFVFLDAAGLPDNRISLIDLSDPTGSRDRSFTLRAPLLDGGAVDIVLFADAMVFTADRRLLIYDALNELRLVDGTRILAWSIFAIDLVTERTLTLVPPAIGLDIGFPSLSHTSDDFLTFDLVEQATPRAIVMAGQLSTGELVPVATATGRFTVPSYSGDDSAIVYTDTDLSTPTRASLLRQPLAPDRLRPSGTASLWLRDGQAGVIYRRALVEVTLNASQFRGGQPLTMGVSATNPPTNPPAELYVGVLLPDGVNIVFFSAPGVPGPVAPLTAPATFTPLQVLGPDTGVDLPAFLQFTLPPTGIPPGSYVAFAALVRQGGFLDNAVTADDILAIDAKLLTILP
jgi:Zn-dependent metalloprotease